MNVFDSFIISFLASIAAVLVVLWLERQRRPKLSIVVGKSSEIKKDDPLKRPVVKWLHVYVCNDKMPFWLAWAFNRDPALACRAWVTFHHYPDGRRVFDREMLARWSENPEPKYEWIEVEKNGQKDLVVSLTNTVEGFVDIPPDERTDIAIVVKPEGEDGCYGWNNESYLFKKWRYPEWLLEKGRYIAKVRVKTGGQEFTEAFLIVNDVPYKDCRLDPLSDEEIKLRLK